MGVNEYGKKSLPGFREGGEVVHDAPAEVALALRVVARRVERVTEHVLDLVRVDHAHPLAPRARARSLQPDARKRHGVISRRLESSGSARSQSSAEL